MAELALDVVERILVRLDVEDLIRCKSVCKSLQSFISSPSFVKAHLNHAYKSDRDNPELGYRRVSLHINGDAWFYADTIYIVGSCNGLLCVTPEGVEFVVTNPSTREHRKLPKPHFLSYVQEKEIEMIRQLVCMGFGYDSCTDDYKVILGLRKNFDSKRTRFHALTLKSNTWKFIGEVKYTCYNGHCGILCGGALHWFMAPNKNRRRVIISLDLSTEEFKEIPLPFVDTKYDRYHFRHRLGVIEECLCICPYGSPLKTRKKWVMKNKWEVYTEDHCQGKYDVVHYLLITRDSQRTYGDSVDDGTRVPVNGNYICASVFLKSLVSPHSHVNHNNHCEGQKRNAKV
ncbi:putative F-box domain-containing protein [Helianthus anomalus]